MDDIRLVVALLLGAVAFPYLTIMLAIMRYERRSCEKMEEAMIKDKYVKHGYWVLEDFSDTDRKCSECGGWVMGWNPLAECTYRFCPWCGAKMDGDPHDSC